MLDPVFWKGIGEFGFTLMVAGTAFSLLIWYMKVTLKTKETEAELYRKQTREDIIRMGTRITDQEIFIREKLIMVVSENSRVLTVFSETFQELTKTVHRLQEEMAIKPCLILESLGASDRELLRQMSERSKERIEEMRQEYIESKANTEAAKKTL